MSNQKKLNFENYIVLDYPITWPIEICKLITKEEKTLKSYLSEKRRIDKARRESVNILDRVKNRKNEFKECWDKIANNIQEIIKNNFIVGIHCTKLLDYEIDEIKNKGLKILNDDNAKLKINKAYEKGYLSQELRDSLLNIEVFDDNDRKDRLCCFLCLSTLKSSEGINCFFDSWGGESIYYFAEQKDELKKIGIPCIVFLAIKICELPSFYRFGEIMLLTYFKDDEAVDPNTELCKDTEVIDIVTKNYEVFDKLVSGEIIEFKS